MDAEQGLLTCMGWYLKPDSMGTSGAIVVPFNDGYAMLMCAGCCMWILTFIMAMVWRRPST